MPGAGAEITSTDGLNSVSCTHNLPDNGSKASFRNFFFPLTKRSKVIIVTGREGP
jgi:hypothetical protein